jgi:hypothetical protein
MAEENKELEEFRSTITEHEAQAIKDRRNYDKYFLDDKRYKALGVLSDSTYDGFIELQTMVKINFSTALIHKENIKRNKIDLMKGDTDRTDSKGNKFEMKQIEIETLTAEVNLSNSMAKLRKYAMGLFRYVGLTKLDGTQIVAEADLWRFLGDIEARLNKEGLSMYEEKVL